MTKKETLAEIKNLIDAMAKNDYLMPVGHTDEIQCQNYEWKYRLYKSDSRSTKYVTVYVWSQAHEHIEVNLYNDNLKVLMSLEKPASAEVVLDYIQKIWEEKRSFEIHNSDIVERRKRIHEIRNEIKRKEKEIRNVESAIEDMQKLMEDAK